MKETKLNAKKRPESGSQAARMYRREGLVPGVLYGKELNVPFLVFINDLKNIVYTPDTFLIDLNLEGESYRTVIQDIQYDPLSNEVIHLDFFKIPEDKPIKIELPIDYLGVAEGVKKGGRLVKKIRRMRVKGVANDLPARVNVNVEQLTLGQSMKVKNLPEMPFEILNAPNIPLVTVEIPRAMRGKQTAKA